jgi:drug/metabolite transporter (DMT)-like permease
MRERGRAFAAAAGAASPVTQAIAYMALAAALSSVLHVGVRVIASHGIPAVEIVFLRTFLTIPMTAPFVFRPGKMAWRTSVPHWHILRGAIGMASMWGWYYALSKLPLGEAATLGQTTGLFVVLGAALWFREEVGAVRWLALCMGMLGAVIVLKPGPAGVSFAAACALASSFLWASTLLMAKALSRRDAAITISFYQPLTTAPWALMFAIPVWVMPSLADVGLLLVLSAAAGVSNFAMIKALSLADASITAPIDYTKLLWSAVAGFMLFGEVPGVSTWIGGALIVAALLMIVFHERRGRASA